MTSYVLRNASPAKTRADVVVVGVVSGKRPQLAGAEPVADAYGRKLSPLLSGLGVTGKPGETTLVPTSGTISSPLLLLVGLGERADVVSVRRAAAVAARSTPNAASVALALPADSADLVRAVTEGYDLGGYSFSRYKRSGAPDRPGDVVVLSSVARQQEAQAAFADAQVVAAAVRLARDWVNTPPNDLRPPSFADAIAAEVKAAGKRVPKGGAKVSVRVLDEQELAALQCGGLLGVGSASDAPPRLVELTYQPKKAARHLAFVGKGITFDSGGLTIKPAGSMPEMKSDMAGAAAVATAILAIAELGLPVRVTAYAALAENMIGGSAMRPGDVLTMHDGTTVEIANTDAEGRLVLADALAIATEQDPDVILDVATLTAHMQIALGDHMSGVVGDDAVVADVVAAGEAAGELHWPMPIPEAMVERIKSSKVADLSQHDWIRWGGGLFASAFLREFTAGLPWAHLDIAGPAFNGGGPQGHWTSGGTGFAVATLVEYARRASASD